MAHSFLERRRTPRVPVANPQDLRLGRRVRMRVVDISAGGVLLWTDDPVPVGTTGRLNMLLDGVPFEAQAAIMRECQTPAGPGRLLGAALDATPPHQRTLEGFLKRAGEETD